ncbi:MAG: 50S ribosomal protein L28 [Calditrichota bacterium]
MSRICPITGRSRHKAKNVSHANNRTRKWQNPNLRSKRFYDEQTGQWIRLKVSARGIKTIMKVGLHRALADLK